MPGRDDKSVKTPASIKRARRQALRTPEIEGDGDSTARPIEPAAEDMVVTKGLATVSPERLAEQIAHKFHLLDSKVASLAIPAGGAMIGPLAKMQQSIERIGKLKAGADDQLTKDVTQIEIELGKVRDGLATQGLEDRKKSEAVLTEAQSLLGEIRSTAMILPAISDMLGLNRERPLLAAKPLDLMIEARPVSLQQVARPVSMMSIGAPANNGPVRIISEREAQDGVRILKTAPARHKLQMLLEGAVTGRAADHAMVQIYAVTKRDDGIEVSPALVASTNERGYLSADIPDLLLDDVVKLAVVVGDQAIEDVRSAANAAVSEAADPKLPGVSFLDVGSLRERAEMLLPGRIFLPEGLLDRVRGTATISPMPKDPDAADLAIDPAAFSFDSHLEDGARCLKPRPEVSPRNFFFSQLIRTEAAELVSGGKRFERLAVTAPIPLDGDGDRSESVAVVGANLVHGKLVSFRQFWSPAAQGLGKLLYSLALAPREEVKLAVIDWRREERASRTDTISSRESLSAEIERDTEVEDIVRSSVSEEVEGGSRAKTNSEATNKPSLAEYAIGGLLGGPLGLAAVHFIRPDTGATGTVNNTNWQNGIREIALDSTKKVSDRVSQTASSMRDYRASVVTTVSERESETVKTRTVRNHNQNHAMTVQYYQVLQHYHVITEAQSEQDVVFVPYAIDERIFAELPTQAKFIASPKSYLLTQFVLRHYDTLSRIVPPELRSGLAALRRMVFDNDEYREQIVTASRWQVISSIPMPDVVTVYLDTLAGRVTLSPLGGSGQSFTSSPVRLEDVDSLVFSLDVDKHINGIVGTVLGNAGNVMLDLLGDSLADILKDRIDASIALGRVTLRATVDRKWFSSDERFHTFARSTSSVSLSGAAPQATVGLDAVDATDLDRFIDEKSTQQGRDYEQFEDFVIWMQRQPMRVLQEIWLREDPAERALRFDRYSYADGSLLNNIENRPVGVEGNYVAFPLAQGRSVNTPIDLSNIRTERAISVPTKGVFAEVYLSCNNATERRDVTRRIDVDYVTPFAAPEISAIATGSRSRANAPGQGALPGSLINIQAPPVAPVTNPEAFFASTMAGSPFPAMSNGAAAIAAAQDLAVQALNVDAAKQKSYLDAATAILEGAGNAALMAAGLPPVLDFNNSGNSSLTDPSVIGKAVRSADPAQKYDHLVVDKFAADQGIVPPAVQQQASAQNLGVTPSTDAPQNSGTPGTAAPGTGGTPANPRASDPVTSEHVIQISPTQLLLFNFDTNRSTLKPDHVAALKLVASQVIGPESIMSVWGMASPLGDEVSNQTLSSARSKTVFDALLEYSANRQHQGPFNEPAIVSATGESESFRRMFPLNAEIAAIPGGGHINDPVNRGVLVTLAHGVDVDKPVREYPIDDDHRCKVVGKCVFLGDNINIAPTISFDDSFNDNSTTNNGQIILVNEGDTSTINEGTTVSVNSGNTTYNVTNNDNKIDINIGTLFSFTFGKVGNEVQPVGPGGLPDTADWLIDILNPKLEGGRDLQAFLREVLETAFGGRAQDLATEGFDFFGETFSGLEDEVIDFLFETAMSKLSGLVGTAGIALVNSIQIGSISAETTFRREDREDEVKGTLRGPGLVIAVLSDGGVTHQILSDGPYTLDTPYSVRDWSGTHKEFFYMDTAIDGTIRTLMSFVSQLVTHITNLAGLGFAAETPTAAMDMLDSLSKQLASLGTGVGFRARNGQTKTFTSPHAVTTFSLRALCIQSGAVHFGTS